MADYRIAEANLAAAISGCAEGDLGEIQYEDALHAYDVERANDDVKYAKNIDLGAYNFNLGADAAQATHDDTVADALQEELKAFNDAQLVYAKAYLEYERWNTAHPLDADRDRQVAYDKAERDYAVAKALAAQDYNDKVALAAEGRDQKIAAAAQTEEVDDAAALATAAGTYFASVEDALSSESGSESGGSDTADGYTLAWAGYQKALAVDESQYETEDAAARYELAYAEAGAAYLDQTHVDAANETRDKTVADDAQTVADAEVNADHDWRVGLAQDVKDRDVNNNVAWNADADGWVDADHTYNLASIDAWHTLGDEGAKADEVFEDGRAEAEAAYVASGDYPTEYNTFASLTKSFWAAIGAAYHKNGYADIAAGLKAATTQDGLIRDYNNAVADDQDAWQKQYDTLLGADEITIGTALANQDQLDTAARDAADETAANEAAGEAATDAGLEQTYNDTDAGDQASQDIADVTAQQTMEETDADAYANALQTWSVSLTPNPQSPTPLAASALEQYQQAAADDAWIHSVTIAQVSDVTNEDALQVGWAEAVDAAAALEQTEDAEAIAAAIVEADEADAAEAVTRDAAWTAEVKDLAGAATTYDSAAADAADREATRQSSALYDVRHANDLSLAARGYAMADALADNYSGVDPATVAAEWNAAAAAYKQALVGPGEAWATASIGIVQDYASNMADAKFDWVKGVTDAEAAYTAAAATAAATATSTDALAAAAMDGTLADDEAGFELSQESATITLDSGDGTEEEGLIHAEDEADAADEVGYAQASADYLTSIWNNYAAQLASQIPNPQSPTPDSALLRYYANLASIEAGEIATDGGYLVGEESEISGEEVTLGDEEEAASVAETNEVDLAVRSEMNTLLPEEARAVADADADLAGVVGDDALAQAAYQTSVAKAEAKYFQDKAGASRDADNAVAGAGAGKESALVSPWGDLFMGTIDPSQYGATALAASDQYGVDLKAAYAALYAGYGDAEITEAGGVGDAEIALATAEGADEVNLATEEAGVADTLATEETSAQETLDGTIAGLNTTNAETDATNEADTTANEGTEEEAAQLQLSSEEVATATAIAGAQADYAIVAGTLRRAVAVADASAHPDDAQAQFDVQWAQGYVQWLTDLKPVFVTNATATAQAAAQDEEDTLAADVDLADEEANENAAFIETEAPQSEQESGTLEAESDAYSESVVTNTGDDQIGTAKADQTQMIDLANAAKAVLIANAKADKDHAVNGFNDSPDTGEIYKDAIADAKLALAKGQADADLAWIDGKALADEGFSIADAEAWQTMSDEQAETSDAFALEDDADVQAESDVLAQDEADQMVAYALADQTQGNSDAAAEAAFQIAQANETATIWSSIVAWASPTVDNPDGLPGLPWMQAQAGLASAEASWAVTSAANYQNYVAQLGTAEMSYANANAADFVNELKTIDGLDKQAADDAANADELLTTTLTDDEAAFEEALAPASMGFDDDVAQARHDDRYAQAQADHDLTISGDAAAYAAALAAAQTARQAGFDAAYETFAGLAMPAITEQGTDDAAAEFLDRETIDDVNLADITENNQAVDDYQDEESVLYLGEQSTDAIALYSEQISDALGHASAIAAAGGGDPWTDLAISQALSGAAFQINEAGALEAKSVSDAGADSTQEQSDNDATLTRSVSEAQTEHDEDESQAAADEASADAQAAAADAVFEDLPDTLIAPADGPALALTPDFTVGYEANDFFLGLTYAGFGQVESEFDQGTDPGGTDPHFMPPEIIILPAYDWGAIGQNIVFDFGGNLNPTHLPPPEPYDPSTNPGYNATDITGGVTQIQTPVEQTMSPDFIRGAYPLELDYTPAARTYPQLDGLLDPTNAPSTTGIGGYSQSSIPTTLTANDLGDGGTNMGDDTPTGEAGGALLDLGGSTVTSSNNKEAPALNARGGDRPQSEVEGAADMLVGQYGGPPQIAMLSAKNKHRAVAVPDSKLTAADAEIAKATQEVIEEMKKEGWKPKKPQDDGAFGKAVHERVGAKMKGQKGWYFDVYVDKETNKVLSIGHQPPGIDSGTYTQVDAIYGKNIKVGTVLGPSNVTEVYDIKTAANGRVVEPDQAKRLKQVKYGIGATDLDQKRIRIITPSERWTPQKGWHAHPRFGESGIKMLQWLGPALAAYLLATSDVNAGDVRTLIVKFNKAKNDPTELSVWLAGDVREFLKKFIDDDATVNLAILAINARLKELNQ